MVYLITASVIGYLLGSISFAVVFSKVFYGEDIRNSGSGNAGATNAIRLYGKKTGIAVFLCDFAKGVIAVAVAKLLVSIFNAPYETMLAAGFFVQLGHIFPLYHGFRGGKGVATAVGAAFVVMPLTAVLLLVIFAIILLTSKYVAVASGVCAALYPILAYFMSASRATENCVFAVFCSMLIIIKHTSNFIRVSKGEEGKIK